MNKFEVGKSYAYGSSYIHVVSRTAKTIKTDSGGCIGVKEVDGVEVTRKGGTREFQASADKPFGEAA